MEILLLWLMENQKAPIESSPRSTGSVTAPLDPDHMVGKDTMTDSQFTMELIEPGTSASLVNTKQNQHEADETIQLKEDINVETEGNIHVKGNNRSNRP